MIIEKSQIKKLGTIKVIVPKLKLYMILSELNHKPLEATARDANH